MLQHLLPPEVVEGEDYLERIQLIPEQLRHLFYTHGYLPQEVSGRGYCSLLAALQACLFLCRKDENSLDGLLKLGLLEDEGKGNLTSTAFKAVGPSEGLGHLLEYLETNWKDTSENTAGALRAMRSNLKISQADEVKSTRWCFPEEQKSVQFTPAEHWLDITSALSCHSEDKEKKIDTTLTQAILHMICPSSKETAVVFKVCLGEEGSHNQVKGFVADKNRVVKNGSKNLFNPTHFSLLFSKTCSRVVHVDMMCDVQRGKEILNNVLDNVEFFTDFLAVVKQLDNFVVIVLNVNHFTVCLPVGLIKVYFI